MAFKKIQLTKEKTRFKSDMREEIVQLITIKIQRIIKDFYEQFYSSKLDNLVDMDKFLEISYQD